MISTLVLDGFNGMVSAQSNPSVPPIVLGGYGAPYGLVLHGFSTGQTHDPVVLPLFPMVLHDYLTSTTSQSPWANVIPENITVYPQIVYSMIIEQPYYSLMGDAGLVKAEYQIDVYGTDLIDTLNMAKTIRIGFRSFSGKVGGLRVQLPRVSNAVQTVENYPDGSDIKIWRVQTDWVFFYQDY